MKPDASNYLRIHTLLPVHEHSTILDDLRKPNSTTLGQKSCILQIASFRTNINSPEKTSLHPPARVAYRVARDFLQMC